MKLTQFSTAATVLRFGLVVRHPADTALQITALLQYVLHKYSNGYEMQQRNKQISHKISPTKITFTF